jgi:AraC-like DNA-binding protein
MTSDSAHPVITAVGLLPLKHYMHERGLDWLQCIEEVGIDPNAAADPDAMVSLSATFQLFEKVARITGNDAFGLEFGASLPVNITGALAHLTLNAPDLRAYCKDTVRFLGLIAVGYTARFDEGATLSFMTFDIPVLHGPRTQFVDVIFALMAGRLRHVAKDRGLPIHVMLERQPPVNLAPFQRLYDRTVRFGQPANRIGLETRILSQPLPAADPELYRIVRMHAEAKIEKHEKTQSLVMSVADYVVEALQHGEVTLAGAAQSRAMSPRALQRELEKAGTNFRDLVEDTRMRLARHYLNHTALPLTEIAFLLGFSELSAFSRAARGWFGVSPSDLRRMGTQKRGP